MTRSNFVFYDWGTIGRADDAILYHSSWSNQGGTTQYFWVNGVCGAMQGERADGAVWSSRSHIRLYPVYWEPSIGWTTIGDAHYERFVQCGVTLSHAVNGNNEPGGSGFNQGRANLRGWIGNTTDHTWFSANYGNTELRRQCNGWLASSDGYIVWMHAHQSFHFG